MTLVEETAAPFTARPRESGDPGAAFSKPNFWIPAYAGMSGNLNPAFARRGGVDGKGVHAAGELVRQRLIN